MQLCIYSLRFVPVRHLHKAVIIDDVLTLVGVICKKDRQQTYYNNMGTARTKSKQGNNISIIV